LGVTFGFYKNIKLSFNAYEKAVDIKPDLYEAWSNWGNDLANLAQLIYPKEKEKGRALFEQAFEKYNEAIHYKPDLHKVWYNWGTELANLAQLIYPGDKEKGRALFEQAFEKYNEAIHYKPDLHEAWYNWGTHLANLAQLIYPEEKDRRLKNIMRRYTISLTSTRHGSTGGMIWRVSHS